MQCCQCKLRSVLEPSAGVVRVYLIYEKIGEHLEWKVLFHFLVKVKKLFAQVRGERMKQE